MDVHPRNNSGKTWSTPLLLGVCSAMTLAACTVDLDDPDDPTQITFNSEGKINVKLGMNPAATRGGPSGDWPAKGSSTELYMARIWDMDATWAQIEPNAPVNGVHTYNWAPLDALMNNMIAANMRPMYTLYGSPPWAAPGCMPNYTGNCPVYPANPSDWSDFVHAVAARYVDHRNSLGQAPVYEVWNEPNLGPGSSIVYWQGTAAQLYDLNKRAWNQVKAVAPGSLGTVVCCGWNRLAAGSSSSETDAWLKLGGGDKVDAVSYHPYPKDWDPSTAGDITDRFYAAMARHGVDKSLWATEVGFLNGWIPATARALTHAQQATLVNQTLNVLQAKKVPVVLWYPWDESHVGFADSNMVGLHRVVGEALTAAHN